MCTHKHKYITADVEKSSSPIAIYMLLVLFELVSRGLSAVLIGTLILMHKRMKIVAKTPLRAHREGRKEERTKKGADNQFAQTVLFKFCFGFLTCGTDTRNRHDLAMIECVFFERGTFACVCKTVSYRENYIEYIL